MTAETRIERVCRADWPNATVIKRVWIGIDRTPPQVVGMHAARPPDHNGWFNHPVGLAFAGSDATSGVASCSSTGYGGPDAEGVHIGGSCTDVAGNTGTGSFALNYDTTPPAEPRLSATPRNHVVKLDWPAVKDAVAVEVARVTPGPDEVVYSGIRSDAVDRGLKNEVRQTYRITAVDRAGNRAADTARAVPTASPLFSPVGGGHYENPPLLEWKTVERARYYNVQLFHGGRKVLSRWPRANELQLRRRWTYAGRKRRLSTGRYCWYVWPGVGRLAERDYTELLGKRCFFMRD